MAESSKSVYANSILDYLLEESGEREEFPKDTYKRHQGQPANARVSGPLQQLPES